MDSLIQFFIKNGDITNNSFVLFLAIIAYTVYKYELKDIKKTVSSLSGTVSSLSETVSSLSETVATLSKTVFSLSETVSSLSEKVSSLSEKMSSLSEKVSSLSENVKSNTKNITEIREALVSKKIIKPYLASQSPKQITERGAELLEKHNISSFIDSCELVNQNHSDKIELDIFLECLDWVKNNAKRKIDEIMYEDDIDKETCTQLLAYAIRDRILEGEKQTTS